MDDLSNASRWLGAFLFFPRQTRRRWLVLALIGLVSGAGAPLGAATFTVTNTSDSGAGSLRQAIADANAAGAGSHSIDITATGTITTASELPLIQADVSINGPGAGNLAVSGNNAHRVFHVHSGNVSISNLTIENGHVQGGHGGNGAGGAGGGLGAGGAIFIESGAAVSLTNVPLTGNIARGGNGGSAGAGVTGGGGGGGLGGPGGTATGMATHSGGAGGGGVHGQGGHTQGFGGAGGGGLLGNGGNGPANNTEGGAGGGGETGNGANGQVHFQNGLAGIGDGGGGGGGNESTAGGASPTGDGHGGQGSTGASGGGGGGGVGATVGSNGIGSDGGAGGNGGQWGGGGGGGDGLGTSGPGGDGGQGGGGGGGATGAVGGSGGDFGGGGGGGNGHHGGDGGYGGGGGSGGNAGNGGNGGFGGGGGAGVVAGAGGALGGAGNATTGGGGAGLGGAIFIAQGGSLAIDGTTVSGGDVFAGTGANPGQFHGHGFYLDGVNLTFQGTNNATVNDTISGTGTVVKDGASTVTLRGINNYSGGTTVNAGVLRGDTTSLQGNVTDNAGATVEFNQSNNGTYAGNISGAGHVTKSGTGTVTFSGTNSYAGGTTVSAGTLEAGSAGAFANNTAYAVNGGTLNLNNHNLTMSSLSGNGGAVALGSAALTVNQSTNTSYAGAIEGAGSLTKSGGGTLRLTGANNYAGGTTVNGGVLSGTTTSLQGNIADNAGGDVTFDQTTNGAYSGDISGGGHVTKSGTGTVTFSGTNSYSGGTTVAAGTLAGTTTSLQGDIVDDAGANVTFDQATNGTYAGNISGGGHVTKSGAGTVTFSGTNSYNGGTTVAAGTLAGTTTSLQGDIIDDAGANVTFDQATSGTYSGSITGAGSVTKSGTGAVTFSGTNSYSGGTTVQAGSLIGTTTSLQGDITDDAGANMTFDQATNGTYSGAISGGGGVTKSGAGVVTFNGANTYTGPTAVNAGTLLLNGSITSDTTIAAGATLGGNGIVGGNVINHGRISPGNSIGTLHFNGNFTSDPGSTVEIEVTGGGNVPGVHQDLIAVGGDALLGGNGTVHVMPIGEGLLANTRYTFLTYAGARTGEFAGVADDGRPLADLRLLYDEPGTVQFIFERNATDYCDLPGLTYNEHELACNLDDHEQTATGDLANLFNTLGMMGQPQLNQAFDQLTGEIYGTAAQLGIQNTTQLYLLLQRRLRDQSAFAGGTLASAGASSSPQVMTVSYDKVSGRTSLDCGDRVCPTWDGWIAGYGLGGSAEGDGNASGGDYQIGGTVFAVGRQLDDCHSAGFFGAYSAFDLELDGPSQSLTADDFQFGGYLRGADALGYYVVAGSVGFDDYEATRRIDIGPIDLSARGQTDGWQSAAWLERGLELQGGGWQLQPFGALQYVYLRQDGFTETGADPVNLQVAGIDSHALRGILGSSLSRPLRLAGGQLLTPQARALWLHEFLAPETSLNSTFGGLGGASFVTRGLDFGRDWAVLGGGLDWRLNSQLALFANYDLQVNDRQALHLGSGGAELRW